MNTKSPKKLFKLKFLKNLLEIKNNVNYKNTTHEETRKQSQRIKMASYYSMAAVVGSRRAWSRALLLKLRKNNQSGSGVLVAKGLSDKYRSDHRGGVKKVMKKNNRKMGMGRAAGRCFRVERREEVRRRRRSGRRGAAERLREVVPGGENMDLCNLLEETAHYVRCLAAQVKVMKSISDHFNHYSKD